MKVIFPGTVCFLFSFLFVSTSLTAKNSAWRDSTFHRIRKYERPGPVSLLIGGEYSVFAGAELGISSNHYDDRSPDFSQTEDVTYNTWSVSSEMYFDRQLILAPKIAWWYNGTPVLKRRLSLGGDLFCVVSGDRGRGFFLRPELGYVMQPDHRSYHHTLPHFLQNFVCKVCVGFNWSFSGSCSAMEPYQFSVIFYKIGNSGGRRYP